MNVPASITVEQAACQAWDVAVIGAGPAGSTVARELARQDARVLLLERAALPRYKVCGGCVSPRALAILERAGLGDLGQRLGAVPLHTLWLWGWGRAAELPLAGGVAVSREHLDAALAQSAIDAGAQFLPRCRARVAPVQGPLPALEIRPGSTCQARFVVVASGLGSDVCSDPALRSIPSPGSRLGLGTVVDGGAGVYPPGTLFMLVGRSGYLGVVRREDGRLELAAAMDRNSLAGHPPGRTIAAMLAEAGLPAITELGQAKWIGTPPLTREPVRVARRRVFLAGDAGGYVEPFTGEGIAWALESGTLLATILARALRGRTDRPEHDWQTVHDHVLRPRQRTCRIVAGLLRGRWPVEVVLWLLARLPQLAVPLIRRLHLPRPMPEGTIR